MQHHSMQSKQKDLGPGLFFWTVPTVMRNTLLNQVMRQAVVSVLKTGAAAVMKMRMGRLMHLQVLQMREGEQLLLHKEKGKRVAWKTVKQFQCGKMLFLVLKQ